MEQLSQLELEAQAIDAEMNADQFSQPENAPQPSINQNFKPAIMQFLGFAVGLVNTRIAFAKDHFTPANLEAIADSLIKVADVEAVDLNQLFGDPNSRFGAWIALAIAVGLPSFTLYMAVVEYKKPSKKEEKEVKGAVVPADGGASHEDLSKGFHA